MRSGSRRGVAYEAEDLRLHGYVALKFLPGGVAKGAQGSARFEGLLEASTELADVLAAHAKNTLHRDVQPGNLSVSEATLRRGEISC